MKIAIGKDHISNRTIPANAEELNINDFAHELEKFIPASHYLSTRKSFVINQNIFSLRSMRYYPNYTHYPNTNKLDIFKLLLKNLIKVEYETLNIENGIWIYDDKATTYYHFIFDTLQRYLMVSDKYKNYFVLVPEVYMTSWMFDHLNYLKIKYKILKKNQLIKVNNLIIPFYSAPSGNFNSEFLKKLRSLYLSNFENVNKNKLELKKQRRVWIDRQDARRSLANDIVIKQILKKYNFEIIIPEKMNLNQMISVIQESSIIVGLHGSGLANVLFANPKSKLIDIREIGDNFRNAIFSLSSDLKIQYYCFFLSEEINKSNKLFINPKKFEEKLIKALI